MCEVTRNSFYEQGGVEICDDVALAKDQLRTEIEDGERDEMNDDAILELAAQLVHGDPSDPAHKAEKGDDQA